MSRHTFFYVHYFLNIIICYKKSPKHGSVETLVVFLGDACLSARHTHIGSHIQGGECLMMCWSLSLVNMI